MFKVLEVHTYHIAIQQLQASFRTLGSMHGAQWMRYTLAGLCAATKAVECLELHGILQEHRCEHTRTPYTCFMVLCTVGSLQVASG